MSTATATHTAGIFIYIAPLYCISIYESCLCVCVCVSLQVRVLCTLCICKLVYSCMQGSKCVSPHQYCDVDLHSQQYVLVIFICFASFIPAVFLVVPSLLQRSCLRATISSISLSQGASTSKEVPMTEC